MKINITFPVSYNLGTRPDDGVGGEPVDSGDVIYLYDDENESVIAKTTLTEVIDEIIDSHITSSGFVASDFVESDMKIVTALREAANRLESVMPRIHKR
jgi:hypothetical protein